jgi:hypothetical protein
LVTSHVSVVHGSPSSQLRVVPAVQVPSWHVSVPLQTLPSLHAVPFATGVTVQPLCGLHASTVHGLPSSHVRVAPLRQVPAWHASACVQALPSSQAEPFGLVGFEHCPVDGLQMPAS